MRALVLGLGLLLTSTAHATVFKETAKDMTLAGDARGFDATGRMVCGNGVQGGKITNGSATLTLKDNIITLSRHQVFKSSDSNELLCRHAYFVPDYGKHPARRIEIKLTPACAAKFCGRPTNGDVLTRYAQDWCVLKLPVQITKIPFAPVDAAMCAEPTGYAVAGYALFDAIAKGKRKIVGAACHEFPLSQDASSQLVEHDCSTTTGSSGGGLYQLCGGIGPSAILRGIHVGGFTAARSVKAGESFDAMRNANVAVTLTGPVRAAMDALAASGDAAMCSED
jgi:hypothetical protein